MKNAVFCGEKMNYANGTGSDIAAGDVVVIGERIGVAVVDIADGDSGTVDLEGVFTLSKASGALSQGQKLFWDTTAKNLTGTASATAKYVGATAHEAALSGDTTVSAKIEDVSAKQGAAQVDSVAADVATLKTDFNALLAKLRAAGIISN